MHQPTLQTLRFSSSILLVSLCISTEGFAATDIGLTLTSEYIFQGISKTRNSPVVQAGISQDFNENLYASLWVSEIDYLSVYEVWDDSFEADYSLGYQHNIGAELSAGINITHYDYKTETISYDYDYNELSLSVEYQQQLLTVINYSEGIFASDANTLSYQASWQQILPSDFLLTAGIGYNDIKKIFGRSYSYWNLTVSKKLSGFIFDAGYYQADEDAEFIYGKNRTDARFTIGISYGF
jgi:uncharacterized protein (TIGR02001 family)